MKAPPLTLPITISPESQKMMNAEQKRRYDEYVALETSKHERKWATILQQRKFIPRFGMYATKDILMPSDTEVTIVLENGEKQSLPKEEWEHSPLETPPPDPNLHLNWGLPALPYSILNYIEAQDYLWEQRCYRGEEGWSPAVASDLYVPGSVVQAQRPLAGGVAFGVYEKAKVISYTNAPYVNPPGHETVRLLFLVDSMECNVPVQRVRVWQLRWSQPNRTIPDETHRHSGGVQRYINMRDPSGKIKKATKPHFLDKYIPQETSHPLENMRQITEFDVWARWDQLRPENFRRLTMNDRKDYIIGSYYPRYTAWDLICHQEDDQPLMFFDSHYIRDELGPSWYVHRNRFWVNKRRPAAYIRNYREEIQDYFAFIDRKVPWEKAKLIVPRWSVQQHNPIAQFHGSALAPHRNTIAMLPNSTWEVDRKTGSILQMRDDVSEYISTNSGIVEWGAVAT